MLTSALLHLYPRPWRQRYGAEMRELLAARNLSLRTVADLIAGALLIVALMWAAVAVGNAI